MLKSAVRPMNSSKNKLNGEIILIFHSNPNVHLKRLGILHIGFAYSIICIRQGL